MRRHFGEHDDAYLSGDGKMSEPQDQQSNAGGDPDRVVEEVGLLDRAHVMVVSESAKARSAGSRSPG